MNLKILNKKLLVILSIPLVVLIICIGTSIGSSNIYLFEIFQIILLKTVHVPLKEGIASKDVAIIWNLRLPRVILAFLVGGALAGSGAIVQSVLKNQLASPYTLGISSGASLGVGLLIATGTSIPFFGKLTFPIVGFLCSLFTMIVVLKLSSKVDRFMSNTTIILVGMVLSLFFNGILTVLTALLTEKMQNLTMWSMGSFSMRGWSYVIAGFPFFIVAFILVGFYFKEMDLLVFGEEQAKSMGVDTNKVKRHVFVLVAILTGTSVGLSGTIGFIDLIAPHIARKIFGSKHAYVVPMSIVIGGCMMVITDLVARTIISPSELPVGAITAIIGGPFFAYIYFKRSK